MAAMDEEDYDLYDVLNLHSDASFDDVRAAFRDLSRQYHPDKQRSVSGTSGTGAEAAFMRIHRAYRVLGDNTLRSFYDRYGLNGVRVAESLSDDEDEDGLGGSRPDQLCVPDDRLQDLERRVKSLMRRREELRTQRLLGLQGSFTFAAAAVPGVTGDRWRRRCFLQYCATSHNVQIAAADNLKVTVGCASHVQGANGAGVGKLLLSAATQLDSKTTARATFGATGTFPDLDLSIGRVAGENCVLQQRVAFSSNGSAMSFSAFPWLSRTVRGNTTLALGSNPSLSLGCMKRSRTAGHNATFSLELSRGDLQIGSQFKYKATKDFNLKIAPSLGLSGWTVEAICSKALDEGLTKLSWALRLRRQSAQVRITLARSGLRFSMPIELWPNSAGPITLIDYFIFFAAWALPPFAFKLGWLLYRGVRGMWLDKAAIADSAEKVNPNGRNVGGGPDEPAAVAVTIASEQRLMVQRDATRNRSLEETQNGLVITLARYGTANTVSGACSSAIDVTDCLMAKVRRSRLHISDAPKSTLLGFNVPDASAAGPQVLYVRYRFGGVEQEQTFGDTAVVMLP